jgi:choline-sulfatase
MHGRPGTHHFKIMVRTPDWKYIYIANGGREVLFDPTTDPTELRDLASERGGVVAQLRCAAVKACRSPSTQAALETGDLKAFALQEDRPLRRCYQFDASLGVTGFPEHPADALDGFGPGDTQS